MPHGHFRAYIEHYFAPYPAREVRALFLSRAILDFAVATVAIFEPIYLLSSGFTVPQILLLYAALYVVYVLLLPVGGRICRRHGYEHTMLLSSPFLIIYYLALYGVAYDQRLVVPALAALAIQKILYWPGYHSKFATWGKRVEGGREISNAAALAGFFAVLAPAFGGLVIVVAGYNVLFAAVAVLILASNLPLLRVPELLLPQPFSYGDAWRRLFARENRQQLLTFMGFGEEFIAVLVWPLYVILIIPSAALFGVIVSFSKLANVVSVLYAGRVTDEEGNAKEAVVRHGAIYCVLSWLARPFMVGSLGVFLVDTFYRLAREVVGVPLIAMVYDEARRRGVMENVIFVEMALGLGKALAGVLAASVLWLWPNGWSAVFVLAAAFAFLYAFAKPRAPLPNEAV